MDTCTLNIGWRCLDGFDCEDNSEVESICGDGITTEDEDCDDGNVFADDGCNSECEIEEGFECNAIDLLTKCKTVCGDGLRRGREECDDSNTIMIDFDSFPVSKDGCSSRCKLERGYSWNEDLHIVEPICGDGIITDDEECEIEENDSQSAIYCDSNCLMEEDAFCYPFTLEEGEF